MRSRVLVLLVLAACGDNKGAQAPVDAKAADAKLIDGAIGSPDANPSDQLAAVKMTADGTGLTLPVGYAVVTYLKPQIGSTTNDPAGFTVQASKTGPAIFVALDPATQTPPLVRGDVINFTVTDLVTVGLQKRISGISNLTRISQNFDVTTLTQDVNAATDLVSALDSYESELVDVTGTVTAFVSSGAGFEKAVFATTGLPAEPGLVIRVPATVRAAIDMVPTCTITIKDTPVGRFNAETQLAVFTAADVTLTTCPAPTVVSATELASTSVRITFSRNVDTASVLANGSQFTFDNGLTATAAVVSGKTVTLTTAAQAAGTTYTVTVANTVKDLQGSALATPNTATFAGFEQPASVKINELNAHATCDLIELRVTASGTMSGIQIKERNVIVHTFAALNVQKNDIVVLHFGSAATCNASSATNETTITGQPAATHAQNYDTAFDIYTTDTGLTDTDNVIAVLDKLNAYLDAVLIDNNDNSTAVDSETAAAAAVLANQWQMVGGGVPAGGFADATFTPHAVIDSDATGTTAAGDSLNRVDNTDENDKADWTQGASTFGVINAGQSALP